MICGVSVLTFGVELMDNSKVCIGKYQKTNDLIPVITLKSNVKLTGGNGSSWQPYTLGV